MDIENINSASLILKNISESGLVHATYSKLKLIKVKDDVQERNNEYEELINNLISENQQILSIANMYKDEYERINISDEDIDHLQSTIRRVINLLNENSESDDTDTTDLESFVELIQKDTLKTMQLLGFNYKRAIGEPATELVANKIRGFM